jgi:hypothetical protein
MNGSIDLGDVAEGVSHIDGACSRCERRGQYQLARPVHALGADFPMTDLGAELANCPHRGRDAAHNKRCDVYFPGLQRLMSGDEQASCLLSPGWRRSRVWAYSQALLWLT